MYRDSGICTYWEYSRAIPCVFFFWLNNSLYSFVGLDLEITVSCFCGDSYLGKFNLQLEFGLSSNLSAYLNLNKTKG